MNEIDRKIWRDRRVLVTGHTGFKGSWLSTMLVSRGALLTGIARNPQPSRALFEATGLARRMRGIALDLRDREGVMQTVREVDPEIVIHLAAQPIVHEGLVRPLETIDVNTGGTLNLLEALRCCSNLRAALIVTSDKCYRHAPRPCSEDAPLGGDDPYSASKAAAEMLVQAYRQSFLSWREGVGLATARAGNVIGSGDEGSRRLVPDLVRAAAENRTVEIRNPNAVRPWQHVLDAVTGYVMLCERLWLSPRRFARAWNFGPSDRRSWTVGAIADRVTTSLGSRWKHVPLKDSHERQSLQIAPQLAMAELGWRPRLALGDALAWTLEGYAALARGEDGRWLHRQIERHAALLQSQGHERRPPTVTARERGNGHVAT